MQRPSEHAFRTTSEALDRLPEGKGQVFLARLVLIMAEHLSDPQQFEAMIRRAQRPDEDLA
ncbi:MAG: hypothetical protein V4731_10325 [Pseudomonadota bacterium]